MHTKSSLPEGYREYFHLDLQKDKKTALKINVAAAVLMVGLFILAHFAFVPFSAFIAEGEGGFNYVMLRFAVLLVGYILYIVLHELTHAAMMKLFGAVKIRFGFTGLYAFAGSEADYFDRTAYIPISLAPLILWGIVFTVMLIMVSAEWFWVVYFMQVGNIAGAVGDIYVTYKTLRMPKDVLIRDTGTEMTFYSKDIR